MFRPGAAVYFQPFTQATAAPNEATGAPQPILTTAFLDLPFPYDGGNENFGGTLDQFRQAIQRNVGTGGRVNSFFDHYLPLYPAPKDPSSSGGKEPPEKPIAENIVPFDGLLNPYFAYAGILPWIFLLSSTASPPHQCWQRQMASLPRWARMALLARCMSKSITPCKMWVFFRPCTGIYTRTSSLMPCWAVKGNP
jgi:hypothetical protein